MASEAQDSLRSISYANILDLVCEGPIEGLVDGLKSVYLDGTPVMADNGTLNFKNVSATQRTGTNSQAFITGFSAVESETAVSVEIKKDQPVTRQITNPEVTAARVTISIPSLTSTNTSNGDMNGTTVQYKFQLQSNGGGFRDVPLGGETIDLGSSDAATPLIGSARTIYNAALTVNWTGNNQNPYGYLYWFETTPVSQSYSYRIEGQLNGGSWSTIATNTISGDGYYEYVEGGADQYSPPTGSYTHNIDVSDGVWNFRLIKTGGYGGASFKGQAGAFSPTITISGKTTSKYQRSHRIELTGDAPWDVRVVRITADSTSSYLNNETWCDSITEIVDAKLRYPNSALVGLKIDSSNFSRIPSRAYEMKMLRIQVPSNYDPVNRTYSGTWNGTFKTAWSDNPAWCFYDLLTNTRYGLGGYISASQIDKWGLYTIGQYCDKRVPNGLGGYEPRFSCNMYIQSRAEAYKVINDLASCFRSMVYWQAGAISLAQDAPSDPVALYNQANVVDGVFTYAGASSKARHTVALVEWNDPADLYRKKVEYVEDAEAIARFGVIETSVIAVGCTSQGQAHRVGKWLLYSERYESETVTFKVGLEGALARPGQVIKIADNARAGARMGGRVASATTTAVTVDKAPAIGSGAYTMMCVLPNGSVESRAVASVASNVVTVSTAFSTAPQAGAIWILQYSGVEAQTFRVASIVEQEGNVYEVTALKHDPAKYDYIEKNIALKPHDITNLSITPPAPSSLKITESLYTYQTEVRAKVSIDWTNINYAAQYRVDYSKDGVSFVKLFTSTSDIEILNVTPGSYTFRVWSVGPTGKLSTTYREQTATIYGKTLPPASVTGFNSVIDPVIGVTLTWNPNTELDIFAYEIRQGASWDSGSSLGTIKGTSFKVGLLPEGATTWWIKAKDTSNIYSTTAVSTTRNIYGAAAPTVTGTFAGPNIVLTWTRVEGTLATQSYEIRYGTTFETGTSVAKIQSNSLNIKGDWDGSRSFWVAAIDLKGNYGDAGLYVGVINAPKAVTVLQQVIDNNILLQWTDATYTLPIDHYEVRKGATWASATVIGTVSGRFSTIFESASGTYKYWVAGVDVADNMGTPSYVSAIVNEPPDYVLQYNQNSALGGTKSNIKSENGTLIAPIDMSETWASHFTSRSWTTPQNQIDAGFPYFAEPSAAAGYYEETIDYGTVLAATKITVTPSYSVLTGSPTITPTISVRKLSTDPWTDYAGLSAVYVTDFRYAKIRYDISSVGGNDLAVISGINIRFDVKLKNDAGTVSAVASDSGGTTVNFNVPFVDVNSITVTPKGASARYAIYDFVDVPNPTSFKVLVYDAAGNRLSCDVSWSAKGV